MRRPLPEKFRNAPRLVPGIELYWNAFWDLTTCRVDGPIPWTALREWAREYGLDGDERADLNHVVRAMDRVWMKWNAEEMRRRTGGG